jgi:zinc transport system substrate-binding protein
MRRFFSIPLLISVCFTFSGCAPQVADQERLQIWVSIQPQKAFVEAVVGEHADVLVMVRAGQSPETYSPGVPQIADLARADIYFGIGMPLERTILARIERSMPQLRFVQTSEIGAHAHDHDSAHRHEAGAGCAFGDEDPHVWMDPVWVVDFIDEVESELGAMRPDLSEHFAENAASYRQQLRALDARLREQFAPYAGRAFYINHPSLGHFARRYGLVQRSIEQGGGAPSARQVAELVEAARADAVGAVFSQPEFGRSSANLLARALEVEVQELDVLALDYLRNLELIANRLIESFQI